MRKRKGRRTRALHIIIQLQHHAFQLIGSEKKNSKSDDKTDPMTDWPEGTLKFDRQLHHRSPSINYLNEERKKGLSDESESTERREGDEGLRQTFLRRKGKWSSLPLDRCVDSWSSPHRSSAFLFSWIFLQSIETNTEEWEKVIRKRDREIVYRWAHQIERWTRISRCLECGD